MIFENLRLRRSWKRTRTYLACARLTLPVLPLCGDEGGTLSHYEEWLENNELELALDELEMLGEVNRVDCAFWQHLLYAALEMDLTAHAARYRQRLSF